MGWLDDHDAPYKTISEKGKPSQSVITHLVAKTEGQQDYLDAIDENRVVFCHGPAGTGKAQPLDAAIQTPDGPVSMGSLEVGDEICSVDGRTTTVLAIYPQGVKQTYLLTFDDGSTVEACGEHLWVVKDHRDGKEKTLSTLEIMSSKTYHRDGRSRYSIKSGGPAHYKYRFPGLDPYLVGALIGDGHLGFSIGFSTADDELLDFMTEALWGDGYHFRKSNGYNHLLVKTDSSDKSANYYKHKLYKMGLHDTRSNNKFIPKHLLYNDFGVRLAVLQGLMDTDGWVDKSGRSQFFCTISPQLAQDVRTLVESLGGMARITTKRPKFTHKGEKRVGQLAYYLSIRLPQGISAFRLSRKKDRYKGGKKYGTIRIIRDVVSHRLTECQCILVDDPSHLYLTNHHIPTHNTYISAGAASIAFRKHEFDRIICVRPAVGAGEHIGFLPGTSDEKMMPYLRPIMLELQRFFPRGEFSSLRRCKPDELMAEIEIQPLEFMRGLTFRKSFIIVDEAQNCTHEQMKMVITRLGKGSKMIVNGDDTQSDLPEHLRGGFRKYSEMFYGIDGIETVYLSTADIVRDPLLQQMMERMIRVDHARSY